MITCREKSAVYKALERNSNRVVVIKVVKKDERRAVFLKTARRLEKCHSPYVVRYLKYYEDENDYTVGEQGVSHGIDCNGEL